MGLHFHQAIRVTRMGWYVHFRDLGDKKIQEGTDLKMERLIFTSLSLNNESFTSG